MKYIGQHIFDYVASFRQKVGIGTDTPSQKLEVLDGFISSGGSGTSHGFELKRDSLNTYQIRHLDGGLTIFNQTDTRKEMTFDGAGNVGIGTNNPASLLHIKQDSSVTGTSAGLTIENDGTGDAVAQFLLTGSRRFVVGIDNSDSNKLKIARSTDLASDTIMTLDGSSNVGIGTATPSNKLDVVGDVKVHSTGSGGNATLFIDTVSGGNADSILNFREATVDRASLYWDGGDNDLYLTTTTGDFLINPSGNVGVGNSSPSEKLDVSGNIKLTGDIDMNHGSITNSSNILGFVAGSAKEAHISAARDVRIIIDNNNDDTDNRFEIHKHSVSSSNELLTLDQSGNLAVTGNLTVSGTTTTINTTDLNVEDKNITINYSTGDSSSAADGAGITIQDAVDSSTDATILWNATTDRFTFSHDINLPDSVGIRFGTDGDSLINHSGSNMSIVNNTGQIFFTQNTNDGDIIFNCDDGNGSTAEYFKLDGSLASSGTVYTVFPDNSRATFGTGFDLQVYHDASNSYIKHANGGTGDLIIQQERDDGDIIFQSDDGSGGTTTYFRLDGDSATNIFSKDVLLTDSISLKIGSAADLKLYHDGSNSYIEQQGTGNLLIMQKTDDKDIVFYSDNGAGGTAEYFKLDGSLAAHDGSSYTALYTTFPDNSRAAFGDSQDLVMYHSGSNSFIRHLGTGHLYIDNTTDDANIYFRSDDGSGGLATYFRLNGSAAETVVSKNMRWEDSVEARFGDSSDLKLYHDSSNSYIKNETGNLNLQNNADDKDISFYCDNQSGGVAEYFRLDGSIGINRFFKDTRHSDNITANFGSGDDLKIYHYGTGSIIENETGPLQIKQDANDGDIQFFADDGSGGMTEYFRLDGGEVRTISSKNIRFVDNATAEFGNSNDLKIYHDASNSYIQNTTGNLYIRQDVDDGDIIFQSDDGSGGVATYMTIDGSTTNVGIGTTSPGYKLHVSGGGLQTTTATGNRIAYYDGSGINAYGGSNGYSISNYGGDLKFIQTVDDKDIIFQSDDGSGGVETYFLLDGSANTAGNPVTLFPDNSLLGFGEGFGDLQLHHDGSNSYIKNRSTGDLYIRQDVDDKDIILEADDGSGGVTPYIILDGSADNTKIYKDLRYQDNVKAKFGAVGDLEIYHDGSNNYIQGVNGDLYIQNGSNDKDIILRSDDGSGGQTAYITLDGSNTRTNVHKNLRFDDSVDLQLGTGDDLRLEHNGTDSYIQNFTGSLNIVQHKDDGRINFQCDDGSGGVTTYFRLDGSAETNIFLKPVQVGVDDTGHDVIFYGATSGRYLQWDESSDRLEFRDSVSAVFGNGADLHIQHDGTDSSISNNTGDLKIIQNTDDKDIIFQCDDQSGGLTTYLTIDGSNGYIRLEDDRRLTIGSGNDLQLRHTSSGTFITNFTDHFNIVQQAADKDIVFQCDDGTGDVAEYFRLDGGLAGGDGAGTYFTIFPDNSRVGIGNNADLRMFHTGSDSFIQNILGDLILQNSADDKDIILKTDDGSGGVAAYITLDGSETNIKVEKNLYATDGVLLSVGNGLDLRLKHDGTDSFIFNETGHLYIQNKADDKDIIFQTDDGSGGVTEYFKLVGSTNGIVQSVDSYVLDNKRVFFGNGGDLSLKHDGSNSLIENTTGHLYFYQKADDSDISFFCDDGSGGNTEYFRVDGGSEKIIVSKPLNLLDSTGLKLGTGGNDFSAYHNGTDTYLDNNTGNLNIRNTSDDKDIVFHCDDGTGGVKEYFRLDGSAATSAGITTTLFPDNSKLKLGTGGDFVFFHDGTDSTITNNNGDVIIQNAADDKDIILKSDNGSGGTTAYVTLDGSATTVEVAKPINLASASSSASSGIYAQFINLKGFCTLAANYKFAEDLEDTLAPFEMALDYGSATISSSTEVNQSQLFRASGFHVPVACSVNAINMQLTCNNAGNVTIAVVEYRPSEAGTDQVDHPRTVYEEVVVGSNDNNNKVKTVTVATADLDNTAIPAGSHIMIMAKGDSDSIGGKAFISAAIEIKW